MTVINTVYYVKGYEQLMSVHVLEGACHGVCKERLRGVCVGGVGIIAKCDSSLLPRDVAYRWNDSRFILMIVNPVLPRFVLRCCWVGYV